jgi:dihydropteroate synthase
MSKTKLMAILNSTPDSFYEGSRTIHFEQVLAKAIQIQEDGADILDIGGESTRPNSSPVSEEEELNRVIPAIKELKKTLSIPISIDTRKPNVARAAINAGASFINDITGFSQPEMIQLAKETNLDICVMHMQGTPETMQKHPYYDEGIVFFLNKWFKEKTEHLISQGISSEKIILDPGIGFGKTVADNLEIIQNLPLFKSLGFRVLLGVSRKWFIGQILQKKTENLLEGTLAANAMAIANDVDIIRVHDVKEHRSLIDFMDVYKKPVQNL